MVVKEFGVAVVGFGTIGAGVADGLLRNGELMGRRLGVKPVLRKVADLDITTDRGVQIPKDVLTTDAKAAIADPSVHMIVELIGGTGIAFAFVKQALSLGKPVITANKALLSKHGAEIMALAAQNKTQVYFEASVGGGIPCLRALKDGLVGNNILQMYGILNGTCNYILTQMEQEGQSFAVALKNAQKAGFAEADPGLDIDGHDTANKAAVLASLAYGAPVAEDNVRVEGIRGISALDLEYARSLGYRIKLLGVIKRVGGELEIRVQPTLVPMEHMLAHVNGVFNAVVIEGDMVGQTLFYGRGAGRMPTASAVLGDIADACRALSSGAVAGPLPMTWSSEPVKVRSSADSVVRYYLRVGLRDESGALARVTAQLSQHGISIASLVQKEDHEGKSVPVVMLTDPAKESDFGAAITAIDAMPEVKDHTVRFRIESLKAEG